MGGDHAQVADPDPLVPAVSELDNDGQRLLVAGAGLVEIPDMEGEGAEVAQPAPLEGPLVEVASYIQGLVEAFPRLGVVPEPEVDNAQATGAAAGEAKVGARLAQVAQKLSSAQLPVCAKLPER